MRRNKQGGVSRARSRNLQEIKDNQSKKDSVLYQYEFLCRERFGPHNPSTEQLMEERLQLGIQKIGIPFSRVLKFHEPKARQILGGLEIKYKSTARYLKIAESILGSPLTKFASTIAASSEGIPGIKIIPSLVEIAGQGVKKFSKENRKNVRETGITKSLMDHERSEPIGRLVNDIQIRREKDFFVTIMKELNRERVGVVSDSRRVNGLTTVVQDALDSIQKDGYCLSKGFVAVSDCDFDSAISELFKGYVDYGKMEGIFQSANVELQLFSTPALQSGRAVVGEFAGENVVLVERPYVEYGWLQSKDAKEFARTTPGIETLSREADQAYSDYTVVLLAEFGWLLQCPKAFRLVQWNRL